MDPEDEQKEFKMSHPLVNPDTEHWNSHKYIGKLGTGYWRVSARITRSTSSQATHRSSCEIRFGVLSARIAVEPKRIPSMSANPRLALCMRLRSPLPEAAAAATIRDEFATGTRAPVWRCPPQSPAQYSTCPNVGVAKLVPTLGLKFIHGSFRRKIPDNGSREFYSPPRILNSVHAGGATDDDRPCVGPSWAAVETLYHQQ
ncbi:hypothetical protein B0H17DRAFT_1184878 [Mycena rosella]|uniref:Uncharacterized protein n=1 Tax=Mycena rosella TaxID=1033263 RepID=A0AAD7CUC9_MYCRO|nr:hypothetical protein B0H17DRAFT_1184878 [Mycena rosella]